MSRESAVGSVIPGNRSTSGKRRQAEHGDVGLCARRSSPRSCTGTTLLAEIFLTIRME
jgi:hypothetical protein